MMAKYDCKECANAATPICKLCKYIQRPGGEITKPTMFVWAKGWYFSDPKAELLDIGKDGCIYRITESIKRGYTIPLSVIMRYNSLLAEDEPILSQIPESQAVSLTQEGGKDEEGGNGQTEEI